MLERSLTHYLLFQTLQPLLEPDLCPAPTHAMPCGIAIPQTSAIMHHPCVAHPALGPTPGPRLSAIPRQSTRVEAELLVFHIAGRPLVRQVCNHCDAVSTCSTQLATYWTKSLM